MKSIVNLNSVMLSCVVLVGCSSGGETEPVQVNQPLEEPIEINEAPSSPLLVFPTDQLICIDNELEFKWNSATDREADPITYFVEVALDEDFEEISHRVSTSELSNVFLLEKGKTFFWRARASDDKGNNSNYSAPWIFYTEADPEANRLPSQPELINPDMDEVIGESNVELAWNTIDEDGDQLVYDIYFGTNENPPLRQEENENNTFSVAVENGNIYYWKIVSKDSESGVSIGPIWRFSVE